MLEQLESLSSTIVDAVWGLPLVVLLVGGGLALTLYSRLLPLTGARHALTILTGRYDRKDDPGQLSHFQALSTALAATIGVGNIGGVAIAISQGGPGAVFWMWVAALVGMTTKFFTCTLAQLYRGRDSRGVLQGGPMWAIEFGLGKRFRFLAVLFASFGMVGCLPMFQTNQLAEVLESVVGLPALWTSIGATTFVAVVTLGGIERIGRVASRLVPAMCLLYLALVLMLLVTHAEAIPAVFARIFREAFRPEAAVGGAAAVGFIQVMLIGVRRAAFSNEAGIGTAPLAHGAAKTTEPVREGLVAMLGPFIDTIIVCTLTALVILIGAPDSSDGVEGVSLTARALESTLGPWASLLLAFIVGLFALSTMLSYSYYGKKCFGYLFGAHRDNVYGVIYLAGLFLGGVWSASLVVNVVDSAFAMMAFPNMIATLILAPKVWAATRDYFKRMKEQDAEKAGAGPLPS